MKLKTSDRDNTDSKNAVASTLRIPLAARAFGDAMFPQVAVGDAYAPKIMDAIGDDGSQWIDDRHGIYGCLARTRRFRSLAQAFLAPNPSACVVNLGCGFSHYFQWLDNGAMRMIDADLPKVKALREQVLPSTEARCMTRAIDLSHPDWWDALALPEDSAPSFLFCEGVMMYLPPAVATNVIETVGERATTGSVFAFDAFCDMLVGKEWLHPSVRQTAAQFQWGPHSLNDLHRPHPRLQLRAAYPVMESFGFPYMPGWPMFRALMGVPMYAVYVLEVGDFD